MSDSDTKQGQQPPSDPKAGMMASVNMAFNMGVAANQQSGGAKDVLEVAQEIREAIHNQLIQAYGAQFDESFLASNSQYFVQIALLGYIIPSVCAFDDDFKGRLFELIEKRLAKPQSPQSPPEKSNLLVT